MTDRWKRIVPPVAGVVFVGLVVVGIAISNTPDSGSSGAKVIDFYQSHHGRASASIFIFGYASVMAVVFYVGMAAYLRRRGSDLLATLTIVGGALTAVGLGLGAGTTAALADKTSKLSAGAAQALNQVSEDIFFVTLFGGLMIATLAMGIAILRTGAMPKALGIVTVVVGVVAVSGIGAWFAFLGSAPLTLVLAGYLYLRTGQPESVSLPDVDVPGQRAAEPAAKQAKAKA
ncbi:MAG TPA: hypothetical protein VH274_08305 [Mycobacteriales bacterium]|jgi:hypothetical protein|nr:hypothetical protein [Mycobacteriales bacterium]